MSRRSSTVSSRKQAPGKRARRARSEPKAGEGEKARGVVLHLDCFSGIAGNMLLGALLDLGLPRKDLVADLDGLGVDYKLRVSRVKRGALAARYVRVDVPARKGRRHGHGRHYDEIVRQLRRARLEPEVRERALAVFEALARAEAKVHGTTIEKVHFHEVGAIDALVDVVGTVAGLARLGVTSVSASPVALGHGTVETDHGRLPLPAPATLELLRGIPTVPAHVAWETATPTGAALLRTLAGSFGPLPAMSPQAVGHGAGDDRPGPVPNVLRAVLGCAGGAGADRVTMLETNLDDLVPEHFDYLMERLLGAGALDVSVQHVQMKKNRPGYLVRVLARPSDRVTLARVLFAESTAIGVRTSEWDRIVLEREDLRVETAYGKIRVKRVRDPDGRVSVSAEYDDCKAAARRAGAPLRDVVRAAEEAGRALD